MRWADYLFVNLGLTAILIAATTRKSVKVNGAQLSKYTMGELVNMLSVDVDKINAFSIYIGTMIGCPFSIILPTAMLCSFLGSSCVAGISVVIIMMSLSGATASFCRNIQVKQMSLKDTRLKYICEILSSIKIIKPYGWETSFTDLVQNVRYKENELLKRFAYLTASLRFF